MKKAFTVIELLVVIVIIGILSAVIFALFNNISQRASIATLQSDVASAKKQTQLYFAQNSSYPTAINCNNTSTTEICVKPTSANTFVYVVNNSVNPSFSITATNGTTSLVASDTSPATIVPTFITSGLISNLVASDSSSYPGSGTTWNDLSGNNNSGTLQGSASYNSSAPISIGFNSALNQMLRIPTLDNSNFPINSTISLWLYFSSNQIQDLVSIFDAYRSDTNHAFIRTYSNNSGLQFALQSSLASYHYVYAYPKLVYFRWIYIVMTIDSTNSIAKLYINGDFMNSGNILNTPFSPSGQYVSFMGGQSGRYTNGNLGEVQIYNRTLSASEVSQNFIATRGKYAI